MHRNWSWQPKPLAKRSPSKRAIERRNVCSGRCSMTCAKTSLPSYMPVQPPDKERLDANRGAGHNQVGDRLRTTDKAEVAMLYVIAVFADTGHHWVRPHLAPL